MKVNVFETVSVDVETSIDVDVNTVLNEFSSRMEEAEQLGDLPVRSVFLPLVDFATKLLSRIPNQGICRCLDSQRVEVVKRLQEELDRWNAIMVSVD